MATKTISELPLLNTPLTGAEIFPVVQDGATRQANINDLNNRFLPINGGEILGSISVSNGITVTADGVNVTAGGVNITAGGLTVSGNSTVTGTFKASGNISGSVTPTTTMTAGFVHIPKAAGLPSGVPTAITGYAPLYFDSANNKLYIYNTTAPAGWKSVQLT